MKTYIDFLEQVVAKDVAGLRKAQRNYGDSWKKRGGVGAFMMLARKWDRLEKYLSELPERLKDVGRADRYDIFRAAKEDKRAEGVIDDIRDLRRYLTLVEAELLAMGFEHGEVAKDIPTSNTSGLVGRWVRHVSWGVPEDHHFGHGVIVENNTFIDGLAVFMHKGPESRQWWQYDPKEWILLDDYPSLTAGEHVVYFKKNGKPMPGTTGICEHAGRAGLQVRVSDSKGSKLYDPTDWVRMSVSAD